MAKREHGAKVKPMSQQEHQGGAGDLKSQDRSEQQGRAEKLNGLGRGGERGRLSSTDRQNQQQQR